MGAQGGGQFCIAQAAGRHCHGGAEAGRLLRLPWRARIMQLLGQVAALQGVAVAQQAGPLQDVAQFTHIAGVVVVFEAGQGTGRYANEAHA